MNRAHADRSRERLACSTRGGRKVLHLGDDLSARSAVSRPSAVSTTLRLERSTSGASSKPSSSLILALNVDCVTWQAVAARPK